MANSLSKRIQLVLEQVYKSDLGAFAAAVCLDRSAVFRFANGERNPRRAILRLLSYEANVDFDWLERGGQPEIKFSTHKKGEWLPVVESPREVAPMDSPQRRQCLPFHSTQKNYWLRVEQLEGYSRAVYLLVESINARPVKLSDEGRLRIIKEKENIMLKKIVLAEFSERARVVGDVEMLEMDAP